MDMREILSRPIVERTGFGVKPAIETRCIAGHIGVFFDPLHGMRHASGAGETKDYGADPQQ